MSSEDRVFDAVFPPPSDVDVPTPAATPVLASSSFGPSATSPKVSQVTAHTIATEQITWDQCWHIATSFLALADRPINVHQDENSLLREWMKPYTVEIHAALEHLAPGMLTGRMDQDLLRRDDLLAWYFESAALAHYLKHVSPTLIENLKSEPPPHALSNVAQHLYAAQLVYLFPIKQYFDGILPDGVPTVDELVYRFRTLLTMKLPQDLIVQNLDELFREQAAVLTTNFCPSFRDHENSSYELSQVPSLQESTILLNRTLQQTGLGGDDAQKVFAEVMFDVLRERVKNEGAGEWSSSSTFERDLRLWIRNHFASFVTQTLDSLEDNSSNGQSEPGISESEVDRWQDMSLNELGRLRTDELFDIVIRWDSTKGAIEELRGFVSNAAGRNYVVNNFNAATSHRLLHPGASTIEILQVYINIIRTFTALDPKGVLLDRVSRPIRRYLRERDDTVTIVVGGLLANPDDGDDEHDPSAMADTLVELAAEMNVGSATRDNDIDDTDFDFDDMNWSPDPVDASPELRKTRNFDVIDSLISLFESKHVFVSEFQKVLGERLLKTEYDFDRETRVLELLKLRFDESTLQACEVMLRDILDSRRVDALIQKDTMVATTSTSYQSEKSSSALRARILSHLFWPPLHAETFLIPRPIVALQDSYSSAFESLKASRKLTWLHALGQVTVVLDLEDRTVTEVVQTWQAAVIYAFEHDFEEVEEVEQEEEEEEGEEGDPSAPVTRSLPYLMHHLSMSEALVRNATTFWIGKLVLKQTSPSSPNNPPSYTVLETLSDEAVAREGTASAAIAAAAETVTAAAAPALLSEKEAAAEKMEVYKQYVIGMLTNGGAMGLAQIVMMLRLTVPGGLPFGNEELKDWLEGEVRAGRLGFAGGSYRMVK